MPLVNAVVPLVLKAVMSYAVDSDGRFRQEVPPSVEYWNASIALIGVGGALKVIDTVLSPGVTARLVGTEGGPTVVTFAAADHGPGPAAFTARTVIELLVSLIKPVAVKGLVVPIETAAAPLALYS